MAGRRKKLSQSHVRLYDYELDSPAYRAMSCNARALLVEFRSLYSGRENRVYMSVRTAGERINVDTKTAHKAIRELIEHGFIVEMEKGSFNRKVRHATTYALTNEPIHQNDTTAPKPYMSWRPKEVEK